MSALPLPGWQQRVESANRLSAHGAKHSLPRRSMFDKRGVKVIALSSDGQDRPQAMVAKLGAPGLHIGYGLGLASAREWGLYISTSRDTTSSTSKSRRCFPSPVSSSYGRTARSTTARCRPCPLRGRTLMSCSRPSISRWPRASRGATSTQAPFGPFGSQSEAAAAPAGALRQIFFNPPPSR